jgi:kynureninase
MPTLEIAQQLDHNDKLGSFRSLFYTPQCNGQPQIYLCGNSLGLQPKSVSKWIDNELKNWQHKGVEAWFEGDSSWLSYHKTCQQTLAQLVGANIDEVCPMNNLTVNLHLMLSTFYRPTAQRYKILTIATDFPSDQYALETHLQSRGYDPSMALVEVSPKAGEYTIRNEDIVAQIQENADTLALVCMSGLHYYTGQFFDLERITKSAHEAGALIGFDLAHAIGNVPMALHKWNIDFAVWCSYKYLNSGPGAVAGLFVHQKHHESNLPRLAGWWGYDEACRFEMTKGFVPMVGASGWQLSTPNILALSMHRASLHIFEQAGMANIRHKSIDLTAFLEQTIQEINQKTGTELVTIMTPSNASERGCQLSLLIKKDGKSLFDYLYSHNVVGDWRQPNCIRLSPVPLYNTFEEIWKVGEIMKRFFEL